MPAFSRRSFAVLHSNVPSVVEPQELADRNTQETMTEEPIYLPSHRHATPSAPWPWIDIDDRKTHCTLFELIYSLQVVTQLSIKIS